MWFPPYFYFRLSIHGQKTRNSISPDGEPQNTVRYDVNSCALGVFGVGGSIGEERQTAIKSASKLPTGTPTNLIGLNFGPVIGNLPAYTELFIEVYLVQ